MTINLGDFPTGKTIYVPFHTFASTGASVTITGLATSDIKIYKDGSVTQRSSTAGFTLLDTDGIDFDGITGIHGFSIDTSDNTDSGFYAAGHEYWVVVDAVTINAVTVSFVAATFSIDNRGLLRPATAGRTLVVDAAGLADANMVKAGPTGSGTAQTARDLGASVLLSSGTGTGQLDFTSGVVKANLAQILGTAITETAGQIAAAFKQFFDVASPTGTMKAITNVVTATNVTNAPTAGDLTATMKTSVTTAATAATPTAAAVTGAVTLPTIPSNWITSAGINDDAITAAKVAADVTTEIQSGLATAADIAAAVLDADTADHDTAGTVGKAIIDAGGAGTPLDAAGVRAAVGLATANLDTQIAAVQSDTDNIQTRILAALTANGNMKSSVMEFIATALTETSGQIAAAFKKFFDKATPTGTINSLPDAVAGATNGVFIAGTNAATSITTALTTTFTGNLTGSVGSLTANNDKTGYTLSATGSAALTEGYAADGAAATLPQLLYMLLAVLTEASISTTTLTAKKLDGSTTAATFTLNDGTTPTSITRAS